MPAVLPTSITGLVGWWKADALTGLADNDDITSWLDSSGNGYTLTPVGGRNPTYKTAILDGKPVVRLAAVDAMSTADFASVLTDSTVVAVVREVTSNTSDRYLFDSKDVSNRRYFYRANSATVAMGPPGMNIASLNMMSWSIMTVEFSASSKVRQGGVLMSASGVDSNDLPMAGLIVGARQGGTSGYWDGDLAEFILFDRVLTDAEHKNLSTYLRQKYGSLQGEYDFGTLIRPAPPSTKVETFTASGTFTLDPRAREVIVQILGGGGGAGSGRRGATSTVRQGGAGGGGGAYSQATFKAADLPSTVDITIGAGGTGGAAQAVDSTDGVNGAAGGTSSFGTFLSAVGGNFGASGKATGTPAGGAATTGPQTDPGGVGNSANSTGTISASQATIASSRGPSGGGAGGGLTSANATSSGRSTGPHGVYDNAQPSNAGGSTISGTIGVTYHGLVGSGGGGGGSGSAAAAAGSGGDGGLYGGGAGGGGGSLNGFDSGKGGNGGPGVVRVITIY